MSERDPVRDMLKKRGAPPAVVEGGLAYLLGRWKMAVKNVETNSLIDIDEYLNDLDARQLIAEALKLCPNPRVESRLATLDQRFKAVTRPMKKSVWSQTVAKRQGWTAEKNWWYFRGV